jgi:hypothetical protein
MADVTAPPLPALPEGLEIAIRKHIAAVRALHRGFGHVSLRLDLAPDKDARWAIGIEGKGVSKVEAAA